MPIELLLILVVAAIVTHLTLDGIEFKDQLVLVWLQLLSVKGFVVQTIRVGLTERIQQLFTQQILVQCVSFTTAMYVPHHTLSVPSW